MPAMPSVHTGLSLNDAAVAQLSQAMTTHAMEQERLRIAQQQAQMQATFDAANPHMQAAIQHAAAQLQQSGHLNGLLSSMSAVSAGQALAALGLASQSASHSLTQQPQ